MSTRHHVSFPGPLGFRRLALLGLACLAYALFFAGTWLVRSEGSTDGWLVYAARFTKIALCFAIAYRFRNHLPSTTRLAAVGAVLMSVYLVLSCVDHLAAPGAGPSVGWGLLATLFFGCADAVITLLFAHLFSTYAPKFSSCAIVASFLLTESLFLAFSTLGAQAIWFV